MSRGGLLCLPSCSRRSSTRTCSLSCSPLTSHLHIAKRLFVGFSLLDDNYAKIVDAVLSVEREKVLPFSGPCAFG